MAFTRLLFAMRPWYASYPRQLAGARVASVGRSGGRITCLCSEELARRSRSQSNASQPAAPLWVRDHVPWLARFWGDGLIKPPKATARPKYPRLVSYRSRGPAGSRPLHRRKTTDRQR